MSHKATCPGCDSHTNAVWLVLMGDEDACPYCGLSGDAMREVEQIQRSKASEQVREQATAATIRAAKAEAEVKRLGRIVERLRAALADPED